jgi:acyl-CoA hydrolase
MADIVELDDLDFAGLIRLGDTVTWGQACAEPQSLTERLVARRKTIGPFNVFLGASYSGTPDSRYSDTIRFMSYSGTGTNRALVEAGNIDIFPCHYSRLPDILQSTVDVLFLQLSPADESGAFSLGLAHEYLVPLIDTARLVIAEVNDQVPWVHGERPLRGSDIDIMVHTSRPPLELIHKPASEAEQSIAERVAGLIEDGACLQMGLGSLPETILTRLGRHRNLGIHSGAIGDQVATLMEAGVIDNSRKPIDTGQSVAGVMFGSRRLFSFAHRNRAINMRSTAYTHNPDVMARLDRFVALNTAIEVDLTGQVNAEVARGTYVGAVGGAIDFLRGARRSKGGLPIVMLPSRAGTVSRIVSRLSGPVSTSRADVGLIVTEYGVADLRRLSIKERMRRMVEIAHPDVREGLQRDVSLLEV